jgi:hypothetical protein
MRTRQAENSVLLLATINNASPKGEAWSGALVTINKASPKGEMALPEQLELLYGLISRLAISMERRWLNLSVMILQTLIAAHRMTTSFVAAHESLPGTNRTRRTGQMTSVDRGRPEVTGRRAAHRTSSAFSPPE